MKWASLLKDIKEKVGLSQPQAQPRPSNSFTAVAAAAAAASGAGASRAADFEATPYASPSSSPARGKYELELDFKRFWEEFRSSSSEKEKEMALNMAVDAFCRLVKQQYDVGQLVTKLIEAHIFSFVVGRAFVTDVEKLRMYSKGRSLQVAKIINFFSDITKDGINPGSNLLYAVEVLVTGPVDKQPLLDSGILCCLIQILNALLSPDECHQKQFVVDELVQSVNSSDGDTVLVRRLEVEASIVHIMKALASHPSAAPSLIEDDSFQLLFHMVTNGSSHVFSQFKDGIVHLHAIQLHRHAMQILGLLLANDNGSTAIYIHKHYLIKVLLAAVKDFNPERGDPAYTMGIIDLLLECVELSSKPDAGSVRLREDIHNAHGYQYLVQFALTLSSLHKDQKTESTSPESCLQNADSHDQRLCIEKHEVSGRDAPLRPQLSPTLSRLLDVLVNLAQAGPTESTPDGKALKSSYGKASMHGRSYTTSGNRFGDEMWEKGNMRIKDLEAIQMLQDIFLKADNVELQAEVLNRMFKIFSSHLDNYKLCQQLRTVPLFILNMAGFPSSFQETILKILEYAVTVVNCIPEQELLSLCCLLQQPIATGLKHTILAFFVKLLSFDQQYKKVLREVGVLEVLMDDLRQHKLIVGVEHQNNAPSALERTLSSSSFKKHMEDKDAILSSPKIVGSGTSKFRIFEDEQTSAVAWDCLFSLLKKAEASQQSFRSSNGVSVVLPFLASDSHRSGVLRLLSCLIMEDTLQAHPEELGSLVEILKSGMVTSELGLQYRLENEAKCDIFGAIWRILVSNNSSQRIFGESTGFSLLLTTLHGFQSGDDADPELLSANMNTFSFLLHVITAGVCNNPINRVRLHTIILSQTFYDLLCESGMLCVDCEKLVIQLLLELALEIITPPSVFYQVERGSTADTFDDESFFLSSSLFAMDRPEKERVYNAGAIGVLIRSLLIFTPKVQLDVLRFIEKLAHAGPFNLETLTSVGCVQLLLEAIKPFLVGSSPLLSHALQIVQVLGAYRLSSSEVRILVRHVVQMKAKSSGYLLIDMMEKLIKMEEIQSAAVSLAPFVEMDMRKVGYASVQVSLGERTWPPAAGYSFVCWFQFRSFLKGQMKESESSSKSGTTRRSISNGIMLRVFSVGAADDGSTFAELYIQDNGILILSTSNSCSLSFPSTEMEEGRWHHLAVVHSKPNALAGLFQSSIAYIYLNGKLRHSGKLGYSPSPIGKPLQVTLGTPITRARVTDLSWRLCSCYLFEEVLTAGNICFMYILGQGYRGLFQDTDLLRFVPSQACGGGSMSILDSLDTELSIASNVQKVDYSAKQGNPRMDGSGLVWDLEKLASLALQLSGKKLIFAFDGTSSDAFGASGTISLLNLVDPTSAASSPIGGIPRYGRLNGDIYICNERAIGDSVRMIGGMSIVLSLVEAAETRDMLHMALELLACSLHQCPQNVQEMQSLRGYHLLALFLHHRMSLFDMQSLEIFFQIAACEASFSEPHKLKMNRGVSFPSGTSPESGLEDLALSKFSDEVSSVGSQGDLDDFLAQKDSFSHMSELENSDVHEENPNCIVLSNADMVEHVLLDWTLWVTAPVSIQIALLGFLERLVSIHWYRNHNLTVLRRINLVQHLLVTMQRGDVEVPVLEKLVVLLGVILEDGFLASELELVVRFVIMTFDPPAMLTRNNVVRETMGKHVIVRNMLLEMLIDLQVTITSEELLEQWHKIVSSKLITYFLDEAVHPTSMRWIMTLLGVCLASSSTFALKFRSSGGFQGLTRVLPSFYDSPEIYYVLFCLIFGKPVYPRLPEVRMLDFHALMPSDGCYGELKFVDLLDSIVAMAKNTFDRLSMQVMLAHQNDNLSHLSASLASDLVEATSDMAGDLQGEALMHKTYAARLMGGEAAAPAAATAILRFMVDLAKMCPPFSAICRRPEFLESCVELYFSCVRADCALNMAKSIKSAANDEKNMNDNDDNSSSQNTFSSLRADQELSCKTSVSKGSFPHEQSSSSDDFIGLNALVSSSGIKIDSSSNLQSAITSETIENHKTFDDPNITLRTISSEAPDITFQNLNGIGDHNQATELLSSTSSYPPDSPDLWEKSLSKLSVTPSASPVLALTSWLGSASSYNDAKVPLTSSPMGSSISVKEFEASPDARAYSQVSSAANMYFTISTKLVLEIDDAGYGGGPCSAGATAVLDFIAEVLADIVLEQLKATQFLESILEAVPLYVDVDSALVFQGLCLSRLLNFMERRLLRDDEEDEKKLDKSRWSVNLDSLCWMIVDRVYMGCFPQPIGVLHTLEFLLSMLQLANKDGRIQEASPVGKGLLYITRGSRQLETYIHSILKNTNRMIMYCFLPSFLASIQEDEFLVNLGFQADAEKVFGSSKVEDESAMSICTILQLIVANKRLILCPSNLDTDLVCCLCINLISLLRDKRQAAQELAVDAFKHLLLYRRSALEDLLVTKPNQGQSFDVLHGGFDKLLTGSILVFYEWLQKSEKTINTVLEQCAAIMWVQYVSGSAKFPGVRIKGLEVRRKREIGRKSRDNLRLDLRHLEQLNERRYALELVRDLMSTELRVIRQDKYGWVLHAESEWHSRLQQLVHERGIFPIISYSLEPEWQLCPIEGPYRMRKKFERCKLKLDTVQDSLTRSFELEDYKLLKEKPKSGLGTPRDSSGPYFNILSESADQNCILGEDDEEPLFKDVDEFKIDNSGFAQSAWTDDRCSSLNESSLQFANETCVKSSSGSVHIADTINARSDVGSPRPSSSVRAEDTKAVDDKSEKELHDNGEYLIRPYLEPSERIKFKYNCERVVGLDKHDGIFLIGDRCLYVIENFYIDDTGCISEKKSEDELSVIDQALGVRKDTSGGAESQSKSPSSWSIIATSVGGRAWAYNGGAWGKEKVCSGGNVPHSWHMWKLDSVYELVKRDYQLRPVAVEIFSMDGCNDLLVFHKKEREEVFRNLVAMNLPRNNMLDTTISGVSKQDGTEGSRLFKILAKSFSKRWQNGEISNFQYLMHLNTLAGRGYSDLTQYPVFPWVLADYESETLDLQSQKAYRKLDKPMGCQTPEGEEEFKKRYESWDDPDVPKFHYGSHYSSAGIVLFYLLRMPPFSIENQTLQGGQFDHADRLFNSVRDTWLSAAGKGNTSDVKELIPEFFYLPEFLENRFNLDLGEKQSGEKVGDVILPPWAKGSPRKFIRKHREALESDFVSENLHHWIDLIFGYKQRGKAAEEAVNVFYHYTYEGSVDIDSVTDPAMKASILAQINHFGQTPKQLFLKPHVKRRTDRKIPPHLLRYSAHLVSHEIRKTPTPISQIVTFHEKVFIAAANNLLKPTTYSKYIAWGFPDRSVRIISYDQDRLLSTHENLHGGNQIQCTGMSHNGQVLVTGGDDGVVAVWRFSNDGIRAQRYLHLERALCAHTAKITCLYVSQSYTLIVSGSDDCTVILWDLTSLAFVKQLPEFPAPVSAIYVNDLTGEILTAAGVLLGVWSINGDCLAVVNTSQLPSDLILSVTSGTFSDWLDTNWCVTGHQSGAVKVWNMVHCSDMEESSERSRSPTMGGLNLIGKAPEYRLVLHKVLKSHKHPVTALHISNDLKQLLSGDSGGHLLSWTLSEDSLRANYVQG